MIRRVSMASALLLYNILSYHIMLFSIKYHYAATCFVAMHHILNLQDCLCRILMLAGRVNPTCFHHSSHVLRPVEE